MSPVPARASIRGAVLPGVWYALRALDGSAPLAPSYAELQRALADALEQQTATGAILRAI